MDGHNELLDALAAIDPAGLSYDDWLHVGMALHHEGETTTVWEDWSARDVARFKPGECQQKWRSFGGNDGYTGRTVFKLANERGWKSSSKGGGHKRRDAPSPHGMNATQQLAEYLRVLFRPGELVNIVTEAKLDQRSQKWKPDSKGRNFSVGDLQAALDGCQKNDAQAPAVVVGLCHSHGAWIRINPVDGGGVGNENVTRWQWALVESDEQPIDEQRRLLEEMKLPIGALVHSGGKSLHAIVHVDAPNGAVYAERVKALYNYCAGHGLVVDMANKNPSRLSRLPGVTRDGAQQSLLAVNMGAPSWDAWRAEVDQASRPHLDCYSLAELAKMDLPPLQWCVHDLIGEGLTVLAGSPKSGKSWMMLQLAYAVATGSTFLGRSTEQGDVYYLAFEDSQRRMADRCASLHILKDVPRLDFGHAIVSLEDGLLDAVTTWAKKKPAPRLVILDTLGKVKPPAGRDVYASDYAIMSRIKQLADFFHMAVVVVSHLRKGLDGDSDDAIFERISGSTGITGAVDTSMVLLRSVNNESGKLFWQGRDVAEGSAAVRFDLSCGGWRLVSGEQAARDAHDHNPLAELVAQLADEGFKTISYEDIIQRAEADNIPLDATIRDVKKRLDMLRDDLLRFDGINIRTDRRVGSRKGIEIERKWKNDRGRTENAVQASFRFGGKGDQANDE